MDHAPVKLPDDLFSHQDAWRKAIELCGIRSGESDMDQDDRSYYAHELSVFDRVFAELEILRDGTMTEEEITPRELPPDFDPFSAFKLVGSQIVPEKVCIGTDRRGGRILYVGPVVAMPNVDFRLWPESALLTFNTRDYLFIRRRLAQLVPDAPKLPRDMADS